MSTYPVDAGVGALTEPITGRWDRACTMIAASVPFVVLAWFLPSAVKPVLGVGWVVATLIGSLSSPPVGLFLTLVSIFASPALFSADQGEGNWGKLCAVALFVGLHLHRERHGQQPLRVPKAIWGFVFIFVAVALSGIDNEQSPGISLYLTLAMMPLVFLAVYNCIVSPQELYTAIVGLVALGQTVIGLTMLTGDFSNRVWAYLLPGLANPNALGLFLAFVLPYVACSCKCLC